MIEKYMKVKKKAVYTRTAQAMALVADMKNYESAFDFIDKEYREHYKMDRICNPADMSILACNLPESIMREDGTKILMPKSWKELNLNLIDFEYEDEDGIYSFSMPDSQSAAFITDNGESVNLFYNPDCKDLDDQTGSGFYAGTYACINMIFDVNGGEVGPNQIGKDIGFLTVFGAKDPEVATAVPYSEKLGPVDFANTYNMCKIGKGNYRLPNEFELASMFINSKLFNLDNDGGYWSAMPAKDDKIYYLKARTGYIEGADKTDPFNLICIQR